MGLGFLNNCNLADQQNIVRQIARSFRWRDTARLTIGTIGSQIITVASLPVLSRLYSPSSFGVFAVVQSFAAFFTLISTLNLQGITPTIPQVTLATRFTSVLLVLAAGLALILLVPCGFILALFPNLVSYDIRPFVVWCIVSGFTTTTFLTLRSFQIKRNRTKAITVAQLARAIVTVVVAVAFAVLPVFGKSGAVGLIISAPAGDAAAVLLLFFDLPRRIQIQLAPLRPRRMIEEINRRRAIVFGASWALVMNSLAGQAPLWIISLAFGQTCAGWYSLATRIVAVPTSFIGSTVTGVLSSQVSVDYHRGHDIGRVVRLAIMALSVIGVIGYGLLAIIAWTGTATLFGSAWSGAATSLMILSLAGFWVFLSSATNFLPIMLGAVRFLVIWSTVRTIADIGSMTLAWQLQWNYNTTILLYAAAESVSYIAFVGYVVMLSSRARQTVTKVASTP